ncbi:MAG: methyltransferase domain-containing protein [Pseudomonadota bacterium]
MAEAAPPRLQFDAEKAKQLDRSYQGADVVRRRRASFDALRIRPGDSVVDIGCGNGFMALELARAVGENGAVHGVDVSAGMLASARDRCADYPSVTFHEATALEIPLKDGAADRAVSIQVFEYIPDIPAALKEAHRVLRPGGRLVISDMHYGTQVWFSDDAERMGRVLAASHEMMEYPGTPALLPPLLKEAGFVLDTIEPVTFVDYDLRPDGMAKTYMGFYAPYAAEHGYLSKDEADAWVEEQYQLAETGRFFFSITHFVVSAIKA